MINTVFKATCDHPLKNDFVQTCQKYLKTINIHLSFEEMSKYRFKKYVKYSFKKYVKTQTKEAAFKHLIEQNKTKTGKHTKMVNLNYSELCIQEYLLEGYSSTEISKLIFKSKSRNVNIKKTKDGNMKYLCVGCKEKSESENELLSCPGFSESN